jgi:hypothetical protein
MPTRQDYFDRVASQARTEEAGGLPSPRSVLLLWYLRNFLGIDPLDAYEYVCDGGDDWGVDGLYLEKEAGNSDKECLVVFSSKYLEAPKDIGKKPVQGLVASAESFKSVDSLEAMLKGPIEARLADLIERFGLVQKVAEGRLSDGRLRIELVLVSTGYAGVHTRAAAAVANNAAGRDDYLRVDDVDHLGPIAEDVDLRTLLPAVLDVSVSATDVMTIGAPGERVGIAAIRATEIVGWPGIDDRSLFDLNVRRALPRNKVRDDLYAAIKRSADHRSFLAYHNGLAVICDSFQVMPPDRLRIEHLSVVNGAQSVVAFKRNSASLTADLRVFVKLVEVKDRPSLAREVSRRSNTQNPVNPRMLMANSGPQLRLTQEFKAEFADIEYVTKPDEVVRATGRCINNDDAAQLLCAIFLEEPWLAVKRTSLFESDNHAAVFQPSHAAAHVVLADEVGLAVDTAVETIPNYYRGSWKLTRIVTAYLAGQVLRAGDEAGDHRLISHPKSAFCQTPGQTALSPDARAQVDDAVRLAAIALHERFGSLGEKDDYKKHFKNEVELRTLGSHTRSLYDIRKKLPGAPLPSGRGTAP